MDIDQLLSNIDNVLDDVPDISSVHNYQITSPQRPQRAQPQPRPQQRVEYEDGRAVSNKNNNNNIHNRNRQKLSSVFADIDSFLDIDDLLSSPLNVNQNHNHNHNESTGDDDGEHVGIITNISMDGHNEHKHSLSQSQYESRSQSAVVPEEEEEDDQRVGGEGGDDTECEFLKLGSSLDCCSKIRCLNCDHIVLQLKNYKWCATADYLFFRLNVPNMKKLRKKLIANDTFVCYACQCQWINISKYKNNHRNGKHKSVGGGGGSSDPYLKNESIMKFWHCCGHKKSHKK